MTFHSHVHFNNSSKVVSIKKNKKKKCLQPWTLEVNGIQFPIKQEKKILI